MQENIMAQGVELMVYGMGTVVVFLALLVLATTGMSALVTRYFPEAQKAPAAPPVATPQQTADDAEVIAAISAAIHRHRQRK